MLNAEQPKVEKKSYTKPKLTEVRLVAEEAVLANCKFNNNVLSSCGGDLACLATPRS
jgi:hypothetical protein